MFWKTKITIFLIFTVFESWSQEPTTIVHFYRTNSLKGAIITYKLYHDSTLVGEVKPGTILHYSVSPGVNKFTAKTETKEFIFINASLNNEYYVKCSLAFGLLVGRPKFQLVTKEQGMADIKKIEDKLKPKSTQK